MRPVRFVALSEDGHALVLADEVGRLLALPRDERVSSALRGDGGSGQPAYPAAGGAEPSLSPRDIQSRIRSGESADEVARIAGVPVDRVLRYAGPVLQERAMLAQHARRTRLKTSERGAPLAEVVDRRLAQHGVDAEKISWDAYRRDDGSWRVVASWPSGKATAQAAWELDKARTLVTPHDDMAHYLCTERPTPILGQEEPPGEREPERRRPARSKLREPARGGHGLPTPIDDPAPRRPGRDRDPIRAGRDALMATLDRPLGASGRGLDTPAAAAVVADSSRQRSRSPFEDDPDPPKEAPAVPSLAVLRPRRSAGESGSDAPKRSRGPSWDEVLFGTPPAARESS
jgi:hypothetical protein